MPFLNEELQHVEDLRLERDASPGHRQLQRVEIDLASSNVYERRRLPSPRTYPGRSRGASPG